MTEIIPTAEFNQLTILEILQRFWKPINLGTLGMTGHGCVNWYHQLVGKFHVYLHAKNQIYPSPLSWSIAKILQTLGYCYFRCFCTTGYDYQKRWYQLSGNFDVYLPPNNQIIPYLFLEILPRHRKHVILSTSEMSGHAGQLLLKCVTMNFANFC